VGSTHALVDVQAIGRTTDGNDIGTQLMKNLAAPWPMDAAAPAVNK
jgi:hypothetical protein